MSDSSNNLPWQLWKPDDLASSGAQEPPAQESDLSEPPQTSTDIINQQNDDSLQALRVQVQQQAHDTGYSEGHQQGYEAGYQEGLNTGLQQAQQDAVQQQQPMITQMQQMVTEFQQTLDALDSVIASRLMQLALTAAKQVIGQTAVCDGNALLSQIQQLIQQEPLFTGKPQLRVHPSDIERVEQHLGPTLSLHGWGLLADNQLHPGGCKVSAEEGDLDASIATRWHELCRLAAPGEL
ncbi:flagellar assembly protein FliH [Prodigiosinella confusarubida]|uniref:Flagellar assembly protein FliH n=1 Tax=Serratia sp. (strain ATCC 39006) TaxID=104623 RepID=A0A2I5T734_SERS3|nr:flagellar assembly protein FliH [Serratia sp. ATCC 39006]AUH00383.1 flagellar assembly protein FliH [Serratia sp. ATCC 39006]AUH04703.1 flagellar assembly protein FliH [Serratia sp. ATCC 39006]